MANDNETVEQVYAEAMQTTGVFPSRQTYAKRYLAAHEREIAAKDAEIEKLTSIKKEYINLQAHVAALRREATLKQDQNIEQGHQYRGEIKSLRALVKELADRLSRVMWVSKWCNYFDDQKMRELVAKAREVVK